MTGHSRWSTRRDDASFPSLGVREWKSVGCVGEAPPARRGRRDRHGVPIAVVVSRLARCASCKWQENDADISKNCLKNRVEIGLRWGPQP